MTTRTTADNAAGIMSRNERSKFDDRPDSENERRVDVRTGRGNHLQVWRDIQPGRDLAVVEHFDDVAVADGAKKRGKRLGEWVARARDVPTDSEGVVWPGFKRTRTTDAEAEEPRERIGVVVGNSGSTEHAPAATFVARVNDQVLVEIPVK